MHQHPDDIEEDARASDDIRSVDDLPIVADPTTVALEKEGLHLTHKQRLFADAYVANGGNGTAAALEAGYSEVAAHVTAYRNLRIPAVIRAIYVLSSLQLGASVPGALKTVGKLSSNAKSEYIRYVASKDILDRVGMTAPKRVDINGSVSVTIDLGDE